MHIDFYGRLKKWDYRQNSQKLASMLQLADGNPAKMNGLWQSLMQAGEDVAFRSFFNSLLSAPGTLVSRRMATD